MKDNELIPHLFRSEFGKITSVLTSYFGYTEVQTAEDIASETFAAALETWPRKGIPDNPSAWLYRVARNKALNHLKGDSRHQAIIRTIETDQYVEIDLSESNILDSQLKMLFAVCSPEISFESQVALALRVLCGFGIEEIANAFLTSKSVINKRLTRARKKLKTDSLTINSLSKHQMNERLDQVLTTLYLLFNEGYYSESHPDIIRKDLCLEAMRLAHLLTSSDLIESPRLNALIALMCFHSSRLSSRMGACGQVILYNQQDTSLWDQQLIAKGVEYLHKSSTGEHISKYHLEANIAYWHTIKEDTEDKWKNILTLYDLLILRERSSIAALNRTYAVYKLHGEEAALKDAFKLELYKNQYYYVLLAELFIQKDLEKTALYLHKAFDLAKTGPERDLITSKLNQLSA